MQRTVGNQTSSVLRGLRGSTYYYITVRAYNTAGTGPPGGTVNVTTKKPRKPDCVAQSLKNTVRRDPSTTGEPKLECLVLDVLKWVALFLSYY